MRDDRERLLDILQAIDRILTKTAGARTTVDTDEMLQVWVLHHLQIIGDAARALSPEFRAFITTSDIETELVWSVVEHDLPPLRVKVQELLSH